LELSQAKDLQNTQWKFLIFFTGNILIPAGSSGGNRYRCEIKACLWQEEVIGNIGKDNIKDLIIAGKFDKYWELTRPGSKPAKIVKCGLYAMIAGYLP